ncbi:ABC transporter substrate-binding protein [soil metagenome]
MATLRRSSISRRGVVAAGGALALTALGGRAFAQESTPAASPVAEGAWTFTDDQGVTITLPQRPTRIAADLNAAAPLWDFGIRPIAVSGWTIGSDASWGNVDRATPTINAQDGAPEPDIEKLVELEAELFVTIAWGKDDIWSFTTPENYANTQTVVPVLVLSVASLASENLLRFVELAEALGADLESPELVQAKTDFDSAIESFTTTAAEKSDLISLFASVDVTGDSWYAASPVDWADLSWYQSLGMSIVQPDVEKGAYWEVLSMEQAGLYPADVFFNSTRAGVSTPEQLQENALFGAHPAVAAGQIGSWNQDFILSYQGLKAALDSVAGTLATAEKVTS